ncbi:hypothetical protein FQR65_LT16471 [Abscondita terminalis]|nr:hypothetical protein FQR65_LT16471 [Abscondita terminalis]
MEIQAIKPGDLLGKRYEVIESLGKGGMASVFKARDLITETILAVKVTAPDVIIKAQGQERFENEKDAFAQLKCVNGGTLKEKFAEFGAMSVEEIKFYFSGICKALKAAHDLNIVHRDIKPENVLLTKTGNIKLGDFGISVINGTGTEAERAIGTPKYMAPEVVLSMLATPQSDIYSLGIMMYEFSVGSPPFLTSDAKKLATRQID